MKEKTDSRKRQNINFSKLNLSGVYCLSLINQVILNKGSSLHYTVKGAMQVEKKLLVIFLSLLDLHVTPKLLTLKK